MSQRTDRNDKAPLFDVQSHIVRTSDAQTRLPNAHFGSEAPVGMLSGLVAVSVPAAGSGEYVGTSNALAAIRYAIKPESVDSNNGLLAAFFGVDPLARADAPAIAGALTGQKSQYTLNGRGVAIVALLGLAEKEDAADKVREVLAEYLPVPDKVIVEGIPNASTSDKTELNGNGGLQQVGHRGTFMCYSYKAQAKYGHLMSLACLPGLLARSSAASASVDAKKKTRFVPILPVSRLAILSRFKEAFKGAGVDTLFKLDMLVDKLYPVVGRCVKEAPTENFHMHVACDFRACSV